MELNNLISESEKVKVYRCDDKAVKIFKDPDDPKTIVLYEALTHSRVEEAGLKKIPQLLEVTKIDGKWAIITEYVEGKTLAQLMEENPDKIDEYINLMVDLQLEIHSLRSPKISKLKDYLKRSIDGLDIDDIKKYELLTRLESMPKHVKLCHGNFSPDNIIVSDKGTYIVDWLRAKQGNASADVAKTYLNFCLDHKTEVAEKYIKVFSKKSGTAKQYIQEWLPIVAAAQLKFNKPEEKDLLCAWIDIVDYS